MSFSVDARTVRQTGRELRQASSEMKGAMRRARGDRSDANVQSLESARAALQEALETAALVRRRALAQGLDVANLLLDIAGAEKRLSEDLDPLPPPPALPAPSAAATAAFTPPFGDATPDDRGNRFEALPSLSDDAISYLLRDGGGSHGSSHESRMLDLEEQGVRLQADRAILKSKEEMLEKLLEVERKREVLERRSRISQETTKGKLCSGAETAGEKTSPTHPPKTVQHGSSPKHSTASWAEEAARRTRERSLASVSSEEEASLKDLASSAAAAAVAATLRGRKRHGASRSDVKPMAMAGAPMGGAAGAMAGVPVAATAVAAPGTASLLELVKLLERSRPSERFDGVSKRVDFDDHLNRFRKAVDLPGLPAKWKLAEMKEWFAGLARVHISRFLRRDDAERAFEEAVGRLEAEFGHRNMNAEDMLADAMSKGMLNKKDAEGINVFISKLEAAYFLAVETDRDGDFHRTSLFKFILTNSLPHLKYNWATYIEKKELKRPTFEDFLKFLSLHRKIATRCSELEDPVVVQARTGARVGATFVEEARSEAPKTYAAAAASPPRAGQRPPVKAPMERVVGAEKEEEEGVRKGRRMGGPPPCPMCQENHPLDFCKKFTGMSAEERIAFAREKKRCEFCLRGGHAKEKCYTRAKCYECFGNHHFLLHGGEGSSEAPRAGAGKESA